MTRIVSALLACVCFAASMNSLSAAELQYPLAVAAAPDGTIYLADRLLPGIWKVDKEGQLSLFFEASKKFRTPLNAIRCLAIDQKGRLLAGDSSTRDIYRFDEGNTPTPLTKGENAGIGIPMAIAVHSSGEIYVADLEIHRIVKVPEAGGRAVEVAEVPAPRGLWFDKQDRLWIVSHGPDQVLRWTANPATAAPATETPAEEKPAAEKSAEKKAEAEKPAATKPALGTLEAVVKGRPFNFAHHIAVDNDGNAFIADGYEHAIWKFNGKEVGKVVSGEPLINPVGVFWTGEKLLVVDPRAKALFSLSAENMLTPIPLMQPAAK
jgi:streptogramin lyase